MGGRMMIADGITGQGSSTFPTDLLAFYVDSFGTCSSHEAGKLCVPIGLSSLSALLSLLSCLVLLYQKWKCGGKNPGDTIIFLYCFLGNLCSTVGAILSRQLYIQILMGALAAAVDAVNFMSCCFPVLLCWNSMRVRRLRMMRRRRRQNVLAVCVLMVVAGGFLKSRVPHHPADRSLSRRRLLNVSLNDNTEILGYILGLISFVIACTSRFPAVCRAILVLHWSKRGTRQHPMRSTSDTESLLGDLGILTEEKAVVKKLRKPKVNSSAETTICLKKVTSSKEEAVDQPLNRTVQVIRVDGFCFSDTSCDSSLVSSDLEALTLPATGETPSLCCCRKPSYGGCHLTRNKVGF
ncbi:transmembrane protein 44 isoform X4 [Trachinotus anak]|uniref:transmembrane protein 44 isoform X4 n=1 Tax=Trachinotus anak TaxID=443729 RepID=UPI0039F2173D